MEQIEEVPHNGTKVRTIGKKIAVSAWTLRCRGFNTCITGNRACENAQEIYLGTVDWPCTLHCVVKRKNETLDRELPVEGTRGCKLHE
jgi:hypothetical protein